MSLKNNLKIIIFYILNLFSRENGAAILLYHGIDESGAYLSVRPDSFLKQMEYLKNNGFKVIKLSHLVDLIENKQKIENKTIVLTFDDGFESHFNFAAQVLRKNNFPATFFVSTGQIGKEAKYSQGISLPVANWEVLKKTNSSLLDIEPHGINHLELDKLDPAKAKEEIEQSKLLIEKELNKKCDFFAPPRGAYNQAVNELIKQLGFWASVTVEEGLVNSQADLFVLKRNTVNSSCDDMISFSARLNGSIRIFNSVFKFLR